MGHLNEHSGRRVMQNGKACTFTIKSCVIVGLDQRLINHDEFWDDEQLKNYILNKSN